MTYSAYRKTISYRSIEIYVVPWDDPVDLVEPSVDSALTVSVVLEAIQ